ncbi:hypothetical protein F2Q70_00029130 [Brassica cretica]|uniref:Uncharacterized protein n=1 Tax=Brassica cretica TaxID=69181 RepID=A0A8S9FQ11_BRACR|nr:hypothetical protein F2Q70_00029130 [Brassica cretica]
MWVWWVGVDRCWYAVVDRCAEATVDRCVEVVVDRCRSSNVGRVLNSGYVLLHMLHASRQPTDTIIQWIVDTIKFHLESLFVLLVFSTNSIEHLIDLVLGVDLWYQLDLWRIPDHPCRFHTHPSLPSRISWYPKDRKLFAKFWHSVDRCWGVNVDRWLSWMVACSISCLKDVCDVLSRYVQCTFLPLATLSTSIGSTPSPGGVPTVSGGFSEGFGLSLSALRRATSIFGICTRMSIDGGVRMSIDVYVDKAGRMWVFCCELLVSHDPHGFARCG